MAGDRPICRLLLAAVLLAGFGTCSRPPVPVCLPSEPVGLPNLHSLGGDLYSGGTPDGDDGFRSLRDLGVKTVISVDGIRPDLERAHRFGLRYVHLPVEYGGISDERAVQLARAAEELPRPIYVHCHHGQHRGPAAAAVMRRCRADGWSAEEAVAFLHAVGTDPKYEGLFATVRNWTAPSADQLRKVPAAFPEVADIPGLTARMVEIDDLWDALKWAKAHDWRSPNAAESTAHLAVRLNEQFREAARLLDTPTRPESFRGHLNAAEQSTAALETALRVGDALSADKAFGRTAAACAACHREHRDHRRP